MTAPIAEAMRLATQTVRAGDPGRATAIIQQALNGRPTDAGAGLATTVAPDRVRPTKPTGPRPRLTETLARLGAGMPGSGTILHGRAGTGEGVRLPKRPTREDEDFPRRTFSCAAGSRDYHLHVPGLSGGTPSGLVVMLHGCTQTPADFATGTGMNALADRHGFIVAYPAQARGANMQSCWNWFAPGDQTRGGGEPAILAGIAAEVMAEHDIPRARTFVAGLSAGAAMAVILGRSYPDIFAAVGAHSGLAHGSAHDVPSAFAAMRGQGGQSAAGPLEVSSEVVRTIVFHGGADQTVQPSNAVRIAGDVLASVAGQQVETCEDGIRNGRAFRRTVTIDARGADLLETWRIEGLGHAWSGGNPAGSYADAAGPDASAEMIRFFLDADDA